MSEISRIVAVLFLTVVITGCVTLPTGKSVSSGQQCDLSKPETTPLSRFRIDEAAGTVFDTKTNLTWKRCAEGQTFKLGHCDGVARRFNLFEATEKFGGNKSTWRLPNRDELLSIVEKRCSSPTINLVVFPETLSSYFWTDSLSITDPNNYAWSVLFNIGESFKSSRNGDGYVRLVSGTQWLDQLSTLKDEMAELELHKVKEAEELRNKKLSDEAKQREADEEKRRKQEELKKQIAELVQAEKSAVVFCPDKATCDKAFSLTQIYLNQTADMKIQVATDTIVETYNPTGDGKLGLKALRIPGKGTTATITLTATCKDEKGRYAEVCRLGKIRAYKDFRPFIEQMLK